MLTQQREIQDKLEQFGWRRVAPPDYTLDWWADEVWLLRSMWSPQEYQIFLTFVVDPQWSGPRAKGQGVRAVAASTGQLEPRGAVRLILGRGWKERLPAFFADLARLRQLWQEAPQPAV